GDGLDHLVAGGVNHIGVAAAAARHGVGAGHPVELVGAFVTGDLVGDAVAAAGNGGAAQQLQVLQAGGEDIGDEALHLVGAVPTALVDDVLGVVDHVGVIPDAAYETVGTGLAIERVVAPRPAQRVVPRRAREPVGRAVGGKVHRQRTRERVVLDAGHDARQRLIGPELVVRIAAELVDGIADAVDDVEII